MGRGKKKCIDSTAAEMKKGPWSKEEDQKLITYIQQHGHCTWRTLPSKAGLQRCGKSCRLRWTNYLKPGVKRGKFSTHEEMTIIRLHALIGNRWSMIAANLTNKTDIEVKNYWNSRLKKRLTRMGIDPKTHKPKNNPDSSAQSSHMAQWESARLQAEARLTRESTVFSLRRQSPAPPPPPPNVAAPPCLDVLKVWRQSTTIPGSFFSSAGSSFFESPTSTLHFSRNSCPTVSSIMQNDVVPANDVGACGMDRYAGAQDKTADKSYQMHDDHRINVCTSNSDCELSGVVGPASFDQDWDYFNNNIYYSCDESRDYWSYLLSMVSSPIIQMPPSPLPSPLYL